MFDINRHPLWLNVHPLKKRGHLFRIFIAKQYARFIPSQKFVAIAGAVGKTTTTNCCKAVLSEKFRVVSSTDTSAKTANLDPIFNIPMTILRSGRKTEVILLEMGIEHKGEMDFYLDIVKPQTAIVTKISFEHNEFFGSLEDVFKEEGKVVEVLDTRGLAILNWDDNWSRRLGERTKGQVLYYGTDPKKCHIWAGNIKIVDYKLKFELNYGVERVEINSSFLGRHFIYPMLAAASLGVSRGLGLTSIKKGLEKVEPVEHRMQALNGYNGSIIIDDTYNAAPTSVEEAIETLNEISARRRILVLGEMRELGEYSKKLHQEIARKIFKEKIDLVFLGGGEAQFVAEELERLGFIKDRMETDLQNSEIVGRLLKVLQKGDVVLVKGSRGVRLDEVVKRITKIK